MRKLIEALVLVENRHLTSFAPPADLDRVGLLARWPPAGVTSERMSDLLSERVTPAGGQGALK